MLSSFLKLGRLRMLVVLPAPGACLPPPRLALQRRLNLERLHARAHAGSAEQPLFTSALVRSRACVPIHCQVLELSLANGINYAFVPLMSSSSSVRAPSCICWRRQRPLPPDNFPGWDNQTLRGRCP